MKYREKYLFIDMMLIKNFRQSLATAFQKYKIYVFVNKYQLMILQPVFLWKNFSIAECNKGRLCIC